MDISDQATSNQALHTHRKTQKGFRENGEKGKNSKDLESKQ